MHLQRLELANNDLVNLSALSCLPHLVHLNVSGAAASGHARSAAIASREAVPLFSGNKLPQLLDIPAPQPCNLRTADFRLNGIASLDKVAEQLSSFSQLRSLALDINALKSVAGLSAFKSLLTLTISQNLLTSCSGLEALPVRCCAGISVH